MQKISSITATATPDGLFTNGSVASGVSPTILDAKWFNTIQNELVGVVEGAGLTLDPTNDGQVLAALKAFLLQQNSGRFIDRKIFTTPGSISYKPTAGTKKIKIIITGGGGRGYGFLGWGSNYTSRGAGGGAGGTVIAWLNVDDTKTYAGVVGRGGDDTVTPTSSTFNGVLTAGNGSSPSTGGDGGRGGLAVGGDLNIQGGDGSDAPGIISDTTNVYRGGSGDGGVSYWGGGIRSGESTNTLRQAGYGSGGGGAIRSTPFVGNFGSHGVILIEEFS